MKGLTVDEREREKLRDILQGMAFGIDGVDRGPQSLYGTYL